VLPFRTALFVAAFLVGGSATKIEKKQASAKTRGFGEKQGQSE
jgi:hypothetical protein